MRAVGFFCDDLRQEVGDRDTIVGILKDTTTVAKIPCALPKLGIYIRVQFDPNDPPQRIAARLDTPWGEVVDLGNADRELIETARNNALRSKQPHAGVVMTGIVTPFLIRAPGLVTASVDFGHDDGHDDWSICATLTLQAATDSPP